MTELTSVVAAAIECELRLLDPAVNSSPELLLELLHPDFKALGSSGRVLDRSSLAEIMRRRDAARSVTVADMRGVQLAPDLVHLTFDSDSNGRLAHRSSLWRLTDDGWLLYFHQGTVYGVEAPAATDEFMAPMG